jgi:hypothetical protein
MTTTGFAENFDVRQRVPIDDEKISLESRPH